MRISYRLYLTVTPAIIGVLLMAGLFYWGQYEHTAPTIVLLVGTVAVAASAILAWVNARFVAQRIERLATSIAPDAAGTPDELDRIARGVDRLSTDVQIAEADRVDRERLLVERTRDYARLLASIADDTAGRLEEIRLPLHILLENRFGDLNENQEEMLGAARVAAEAADADLVSLRQIAELDLGDHPLRRDRMKPSDIVEALRPMLVAAAESAGAAVEVSVAPLLPAVIGDRARLQDALATLLGDAVRSSASGTRVRMSVEQQNDKLTVEVLGTRGAPSSVRSAAAARVIDAHGGSVSHRDDALVLTLPLENRPTSTRTRVASAM
jgi:signal transduction histidine kinase